MARKRKKRAKRSPRACWQAAHKTTQAVCALQQSVSTFLGPRGTPGFSEGLLLTSASDYVREAGAAVPGQKREAKDIASTIDDIRNSIEKSPRRAWKRKVIAQNLVALLPRVRRIRELSAKSCRAARAR